MLPLFDIASVPVPLSVALVPVTTRSVRLPPEFNVIVPLLTMEPFTSRTVLLTTTREEPATTVTAPVLVEPSKVAALPTFCITPPFCDFSEPPTMVAPASKFTVPPLARMVPWVLPTALM